ncbi:hypothetical protein A176_001957 [Myxococcus hansupus]|uniref:Uncharacterized protein n=1 Tax=Pseudomyxococcus hansupus TaxID=1297742 RepID=A0A0H4WUR8_9BACT|nr:hypothetical protein A176_001957 [Myxococcus hansupus]
MNGHRDYQEVPALARETERAAHIDLPCAFVRFAGPRQVWTEAYA